MTKMSISEHANLAEYIERAILGCIFRLQSSTKNVKNTSRKRALLCSVRSVNELNDPLITSGDAFWWVNSLGARRCQLGSILLLGPVRYGAEVRAFHALCEIRRVQTEWRNLRGEGGAAVVVIGPLQKDCDFQKTQNLKINLLLKSSWKCIFKFLSHDEHF